jgi:hypothetical protein
LKDHDSEAGDEKHKQLLTLLDPPLDLLHLQDVAHLKKDYRLARCCYITVDSAMDASQTDFALESFPFTRNPI